MATDERVVNRRRLINRLMVQLDEADANTVSNNDIRRLLEDLPRILAVARQLERYPKGLPIPDPNDVVKADHCTTDVLRRYAQRGDEATISVELLEATKAHIKSCSVCRARWCYFQRQFEPTRVCGQPIVPHTPQPVRLLSENNITSGFGTHKPDVVHLLSHNRAGRLYDPVQTEFGDDD